MERPWFGKPRSGCSSNRRTSAAGCRTKVNLDVRWRARRKNRSRRGPPNRVPSGSTRHRAISAISQARAIFQSRITLCGEIFSTSAVSSTLSPPKDRSSISLACPNSICAVYFPSFMDARRRSSHGGGVMQSAPAGKLLSRRLGPSRFTEGFHRNALVTDVQYGQVFRAARHLKDYTVARFRLHQRARQW